MSNFALYMIGIVLITAACAYGAYLLGLGGQWIAVGGLLVFGLGITAAVRKTRQRDPSASSQG